MVFMNRYRALSSQDPSHAGVREWVDGSFVPTVQALTAPSLSLSLRNASTAAANGSERRTWSPWETWASGTSWPSWLPRKTRHWKARATWAAWPCWPPWLLPDRQGRSPRASRQDWTTRAAGDSGRARDTRGPGPPGPSRAPWPPWALRHCCPWETRPPGGTRAPRIWRGARAPG